MSAWHQSRPITGAQFDIARRHTTGNFIAAFPSSCASILVPCLSIIFHPPCTTSALLTSRHDRTVLSRQGCGPSRREDSFSIVDDLLRCRRHKLPNSILRHRAGRTTSTTKIWRTEGSRQDIPELIRPSWHRSQVRHEVWRLVQDQGDCIEGS